MPPRRRPIAQRRRPMRPRNAPSPGYPPPGLPSHPRCLARPTPRPRRRPRQNPSSSAVTRSNPKVPVTRGTAIAGRRQPEGVVRVPAPRQTHVCHGPASGNAAWPRSSRRYGPRHHWRTAASRRRYRQRATPIIPVPPRSRCRAHARSPASSWSAPRPAPDRFGSENRRQP
jgi:hypothetical protein